MKRKTGKERLAKYATGGTTDLTGNSSGGSSDSINASFLGLATSALPGIANLLSTAFDNSAKSYSKEPLVNPTSMRVMMDPYNNNGNNIYATGGEIGDDQGQDENSAAMQQLQEIADEKGMSLEDLLQVIQSHQDGDFDDISQDDATDDESNPDDQDDDTSDEYDPQSQESDNGDDTPSFAYGGIHIKGANKGKFNALKKRTGKTTEQLTHSKNPLTRKRATFAQNAAKWNHFATGGVAGNNNDNINVEGGEVMQTSQGGLSKIIGPKHEDGGVNLNVPDGTKIYSKRLKIDGKTMEERKLSRERALKRVHKLYTKNPNNNLLRNTLSRTVQTNMSEENKDMAVQQALHGASQTAQKFATGGQAGDGGPDNNPMPGESYGDWMKRLMGLGPVGANRTTVPYLPGYTPPVSTDVAIAPPEAPVINPVNTTGMKSSTIGTGINTKAAPVTYASPANKGNASVTLGDVIGMAGNVFNAVAPIINTNNNRRATRPNINRFLGYGHTALDTNTASQDYVAAQEAHVNSDIDTAAGSSKISNANNARGVNTLRALNIATDFNADKSRGSAADSFSNKMINILAQRENIELSKDKAEMTGATQVDQQNKADTDNYYSNMAQNLTNFGTNVQGLGSAINVTKSNQVDEQLLSELSRYGLGVDESGHLYSTNKKTYKTK